MSFPKNPRSGASRLRLTLLLLLLVVPASGGAATRERVRVVPSFSVFEEFRSNALTHERAEESDFVTRLTPGLKIESEGETGHARIELSFPARLYARFSELNTIDQDLQAEVARKLSERLTFFAEGAFRNYDDRDPVRIDDIELNFGLDDSTVSSLNSGLRYQFTARGLGQIAASFTDVDFGENRRGYNATILSALYNYTLSLRDQLGLTVALQDYAYTSRNDLVRNASFSALPAHRRHRGGEDQLVSLVRGSWTRTWSPRWTSMLTLGARHLNGGGEDLFIDGDKIPVSNSGSSVGLIGSASLRRRLINGFIELTIDQETRPSSGFGASLDIRSIRLAYRRKLAPRWTLNASGILRQFESAQDADQIFVVAGGDGGMTSCVNGFRGQFLGPLPSNRFRGACQVGSFAEVDSDTLSGNVSLRWQMRRDWTTVFAYDFIRQTGSALRSSSYNDHRFRVGFDWAYDMDVP